MPSWRGLGRYFQFTLLVLSNAGGMGECCMLSGKGLCLGLNTCQCDKERGGPDSLGAVEPCEIKKNIR